MSNIKTNYFRELNLPLWFRITILCFVFSHWYIFLHALSLQGDIDPFRGSRALLYFAFLAFMVIEFVIVGLVWLVPNNRFCVTGYLYLRQYRWVIAFFGFALLLGLLISGKSISSLSRVFIYLNVLSLALAGLYLKPIPKAERLPIPRIPNWFLMMVVAVAPALFSVVLINIILEGKLTNYHPYIWNDQVGYWHWTRSFIYYGFSGGYNGWDEFIAPAEFIPFGANGPYYPVIYGIIGRIFGWKPYLPILINMGLITFSLFIFMRVAQLERKQIIITGVSIIFLWPVLVYMTAAMHESLNQAIAILSAGIFYLLIISKRHPSSLLKFCFVIFLIFASFVRLSWGILLLPLLFLVLRGKLLLRLLLSIGLSLLIGFVIIRINSYLIPPTANIIYSLFRGVASDGPIVILNHISNEFHNLIALEKNRINLVIVIQVIILAGWCLINLILKIRKEKLSFEALLQSLPFFNLYNLLLPLGLAFLFYLVHGFNRVLIANILITTLLLIAAKEYKPVFVVLIISIVGFIPFFNEYKLQAENYIPVTKEFLDSQELIERHVYFDSETENRWCNTLLLPVNKFNYYVPMIPPGIGVSPIVFPENLEFPLKSKYLLFHQNTFKNLPSDVNAQHLVSLPNIDLYFNLDSGCPLP